MPFGLIQADQGFYMSSLDDLGPLPQSDENSLLQAESFKAFEAA
jgi:hypothetical protein